MANIKKIQLPSGSVYDIYDAGAARKEDLTSLKTEIKSEILGAAPEELDTLEELAAALGADGNFSTTVKNQIGQKQDKISHKTEAEWDSQGNIIPALGEILIYDIDETYNYERVKIGDGTTKINDLPFIDIQADWNQSDSTRTDFIKNKPVEMTEDDAFNMLVELSVIVPVVNEDGAIYTDENGAILTI